MTESSVAIPDVEIHIPPRPEYVGVVRHVMGAVARLGQHTPEFVENAKLAGSEATTNAVAMSQTAEADDPIEVRAALSDDRLDIWVLDRGPSGPDAQAQPERVDFSFDRELSLPLLEGLVDHLEIQARDGGGNALHMTLLQQEDDAGAE